MPEITPTSVFFTILFILPGFLAYSVSTSLYRKTVGVSEIEITYKSLLYSSGMYAIIKIVFVLLDRSLTRFMLDHLLLACVIMVILSTIWGIAVFHLNTHDVLYKVLRKLRLVGKITPPNMYAAILDPNFQPLAKNGYWIMFRKNYVLIEGFVAFTDLAEDVRLIYIKEVKEFDDEGNLLIEHPETYGMFVDVTSIEGVNIVYPQ